MSTRKPAFWCATAVLLLALVGACGGDAEPTKDKTAPEATATAAEKTGPLTITTPAEKFCDKIDLAAVSDLFGGEASIVKDVEAGDKITDPTGEEATSENTFCDIRTGAGTQGLVYLLVADQKSGDKQIKNFSTFGKQTKKRYEASYEAAGATCKDVETGGLGDPAVGLQCGTSKPGAFVYITFAGVFGDAYVTCGYSDLPQEKPEKELDSLVEPTRTFCLDAVKAIAD